MNFFAFFLLHSLTQHPEDRLKLKRSFVDSVCNGEIQKVRNDVGELWQSKSRFWVLAPFAWNRENVKPLCLFLSLSTVIMSLLSLVMIAKGAISSSVELIVSGIFVLLIATPLFLSLSMNAAIQNEKDPGLALVRCWLVLRSRLSESSLQSVRDIENELSKIVEPVSPGEYIKTKEISRKLSRISFALVLVCLGSWLYLMFLDPWLPHQRPLLAFPYLASIMLALAPAMVGTFIEIRRMPIRVSNDNIHMLAIPRRYCQEPSIDNVIANYEGESVHRKLVRRAKWFYYFGLFCGWDDEKLGEVILSFLSATLYLLMNINPWLNMFVGLGTMFYLFTVLTIFLAIYSVFGAWIHGGGVKKAMKRRETLRRLIDRQHLSKMIALNDLIEIFSSGSYGKKAKTATPEEYLTRLYIKSLGKRAMYERRG